MESTTLFTHQDFSQLCTEIENEKDYEVLYNDLTSGIKMWIKTRGEGSENVIKRHKCRGTLPFSSDIFYATVKDHRWRKQWDPRDLGITTIEGPYVNDDKENGLVVNVVERLTKAGTWPLGNRDFVTLGGTMKETVKEGNRFIMIGRSVVHRNAPDCDNFVRGHIQYYGLVLQPTKNPNECEYWSIVEADPKGWIPQSVYNYVTRFGPKEFEDSVKKGIQMRLEQNLSDQDCCDEYLFM
jgi:hypothetical protein